MDTHEEAKLKKVVEKLENARLNPEERIEDNIQLAGIYLKDIVRYFIYQLICAIITGLLAATTFNFNNDSMGVTIIAIGSVTSVIFSIKIIFSIWKAGKCLINHKNDLF